MIRHLLVLLSFVFVLPTAYAAPTTKKPLKVVMLQFDPIAGDFEYNFSEIKKGYERAVRDGADIVITPETALEGYSLGDYFERPEMWARSVAYAEKLQALTQGQKTALLLGHTVPNPEKWGKPLQNVASAFVDGKLAHRHAKVLLPDYDIFNDARWFHPGRKANVWRFRGHKIAVGICEDWWFEDDFTGFQGPRQYYDLDIKEIFKKKGVDLAVSLSASPYGRDKAAYRERIHGQVASYLGVPFLWVGMSGATDSILYDGRSFILNAKGETVDRLGLFKNDYAVVEFPEGVSPSASIKIRKDSAGENTNPEEIEVVYQALVTGIREYARRTGQVGMVLGISGGIDSAVVAALIVDALGSDKLKAVSLPSEYSSDHSMSDAYKLAQNLNLRLDNVDTIEIKQAYNAVKRSFGPKFWEQEGLIDENSQARLRMLILNGVANRFPGYMVAVTGNKTEYAMGYFTFGGDDKGSLGIIGGLWKSEVYALARYINERSGREIIPWNTINKPASAELKKNQVSYGAKDSMPPFDILDPLLMDYFENRIPLQDLVDRYTRFQPDRPKDWVAHIIRKAELMDYKRRQCAPLLRVDRRKTFDWIGRRVPIAKANVHAAVNFCSDALAEGPQEKFKPLQWFTSTLTPTLEATQ